MTIPKLIVKLQEQEAALDPRNQPTPRGQDEIIVRKQAIALCISGLKNLPADLALPVAHLVDLEARRQEVVDKEKSIEQAIHDAPDWQSIADVRARETEYDRQQQLRRQLERLREGSLFASPGVTYLRVADLDIAIAEQTRRRDQTQAALDACIAQAEVLLGAAVSV